MENTRYQLEFQISEKDVVQAHIVPLSVFETEEQQNKFLVLIKDEVKWR